MKTTQITFFNLIDLADVDETLSGPIKECGGRITDASYDKASKSATVTIESEDMISCLKKLRETKVGQDSSLAWIKVEILANL